MKRSKEIAKMLFETIDNETGIVIGDDLSGYITEALDQHAKEVEEATIARCATKLADTILETRFVNYEQGLFLVEALRNLNKEGK